MYAIKAEITDPSAESWAFKAQKTMYLGKHIASGDEVFVFASENEGGLGLIAAGTVASVMATPRKVGIERQTPRVSIAVNRMSQARCRLGREELKPFCEWNDGRPQTELNFKLYRQATNKIVSLSAEAAAFLRSHFQQNQQTWSLRCSCCLSRCLSGFSTVSQQARFGGARYVFASPGLASYRRCPLCLKVRRHGTTSCVIQRNWLMRTRCSSFRQSR